MTTSELLELDWREEDNRRKIQKVLKLIKPLSKEIGIIPLEKLERAIKVMCEKYGLWIRELGLDIDAGDEHIVWRATVIDVANLETIRVVYGCTLYEVIAKTTIFLYSEIRRRN